MHNVHVIGTSACTVHCLLAHSAGTVHTLPMEIASPAKVHGSVLAAERDTYGWDENEPLSLFDVEMDFEIHHREALT